MSDYRNKVQARMTSFLFIVPSYLLEKTTKLQFT